MEQVNVISLLDLRNSEYCELIVDMKTLLPGVLPQNAKVDELMARFTPVFEKLDEANRVDMGSVMTALIQTADKERGTTWKGMDLIVDAYLNSPVQAQLDSAIALRRVFDVYGDFRKRGYDAESSDGRNLVQDLEKLENDEHCKRIKLNTWVPLYKGQLETFKELQNQRDNERGYKSSGDVKAVRALMDPLYREIIDMVHAFIMVGMATPEMENFVVIMNQKIKRYKDLLAARQGRKDGEEDENPMVD